MSRTCRSSVVVCVCLFSAGLLAGPARGQGRGPTPVAVAPAVEREIPSSLRLVGTIYADKRAIVASEVAGLVAVFPAEQGQFLRQGEAILRFDRTTAELDLAEAEARLSSLQATLTELEKGERDEVRMRLKEAVGEAATWVEKWQFEVERLRSLSSLSQTSRKELHDAEMELAAAESRHSQARAANEMAENGSRPEEIARARYDVAAQAAVVARQRRDLEKTSIAAPFDGFIVTKRTEVGEWIAAGGPVCEMVAIEKVRVRTDVPESAIPFATVGQPASVEVEALSAQIGATISRVIPLATPTARTFPVEIDVPNESHRLLPGMFVWAHVPAAAPGKRLMVPKDAVVARGTEKTIFVVRDMPADPAGGPPGAGAPPSGGRPPGAEGAPPTAKGEAAGPPADSGQRPAGQTGSNDSAAAGHGRPSADNGHAEGGTPEPGTGPVPRMAIPTPVITGLEVEGLIEVQAAGLHPGDLVVIRANERLLPFMPNPVIPLPAAANGSAPAASTPASRPAPQE